MNTGVIGLGDMGSGLAKNLIANGFNVIGLDLDPRRVEAFEALGGEVAKSPKEVGAKADAVFVMVMNGDQAKSVIFGENGLTASMAAGGAILLSATIKPREAKEIGEALEDTGLHIIDTPVSGGFPGGSGQPVYTHGHPCGAGHSRLAGGQGCPHRKAGCPRG